MKMKIAMRSNRKYRCIKIMNFPVICNFPKTEPIFPIQSIIFLGGKLDIRGNEL
jgi:hypothetical protein